MMGAFSVLSDIDLDNIRRASLAGSVCQDVGQGSDLVDTVSVDVVSVDTASVVIDTSISE